MVSRSSAEPVVLLDASLGQVQAWFAERFEGAMTPRAEKAGRVSQMASEVGAHPACSAVALLRALPWDILKNDPLVALLSEDILLMVKDLDRSDAVLEKLALTARQTGSQKTQDESLRKLMLTLAQDVRAVVVLLTERLDDLRSAANQEEEARRRLAEQTLTLHAPLANRIGVWQLKWELEDLAFRYLNPDTYKSIAKLLDERRTDREHWIEGVIEAIRSALKGLGIEGVVQGRPKHIYSIWRKMQQKGLSFQELMDVRAVRVIVQDVAECYRVLASVHDHWRAIEGEFDDYIAQPKGNFYRSLHTAVMGPQDKPLEVQIRTEQMHRESELGVAAHWRYKEGSKSDRRFDDRVVWLRQMLAWGREIQGAAPDSPTDEPIYVFTPQGRVIDLPMGATPIDFAYHLHTDLGHRCRGARVDGIIVPLTHRLESGQWVEITVAKQGGPSLDWLNPELGYLHSPRAMAKVRHWFKQQNQEEDLAHGRQILDRAIQRAHRGHPNAEQVAKALGFDSTNELLFALARGDVSLRQLDQVLHPRDEENNPEPTIEITAPRRIKEGGAGAIQVLGLTNIATTLAKCCRPVPPESIVGFVTRGHGVTIHREDCLSVQGLTHPQKERLIPAAWGESPKDQFAVDIAVEARDRHGLLRDISDALTREKVNVTAVNTLTRGDTAHMQFTLAIQHRDQLTAALRGLMAVDGVERAYRRSP